MARTLSIPASALLLALWSCREPPLAPGHYALTVETDKAGYSFAGDSSVTITITNGSDRPVYLPMEIWVVVERLVGGQWADAQAWVTADGVTPYWYLAPGGSARDHLPLRAYLAGQPGTYRVRYCVYADRDMSQPLPLEERISPPFTVAP